MMLFFFAGFETVSTALCFMVYELAVNQDVQTKLRREIDDVLKETDGKITYDALINQMSYLDMVVSGKFTNFDNFLQIFYLVCFLQKL